MEAPGHVPSVPSPKSGTDYRIVGKWRRPIQKATRRAHGQQKPEMEVLDSLYVNEDATIN